jgi:purine nucleosidase
MKKIIIDTDCGIDDTSATLLALSTDCEILGICAVEGNTDVTNGVENLKKLLALSKRTEIPVFKGCESPLVSGFGIERWPGHDKDGLGGFTDTADVISKSNF